MTNQERQETAQWLASEKLAKCAVCRDRRDRSLRKAPWLKEFDHVVELCAIFGAKRFNLGSFRSAKVRDEVTGELRGVTVAEVRLERAKCQILCGSCHKEKTRGLPPWAPKKKKKKKKKKGKKRAR